MKREYRVFLLVGVLVLAGASFAYALFGFGHSSGGSVESYRATLDGLNQDMRATLHKIREESDKKNTIELLHDQLHLMKKILHMVDKEARQEKTFVTLHDLNHQMRDAWHAVKKDHHKEDNLKKLHDQLHNMKEVLAPDTGGSGESLH